MRLADPTPSTTQVRPGPLEVRATVLVPLIAVKVQNLVPRCGRLLATVRDATLALHCDGGGCTQAVARRPPHCQDFRCEAGCFEIHRLDGPSVAGFGAGPSLPIRLRIHIA